MKKFSNRSIAQMAVILALLCAIGPLYPFKIGDVPATTQMVFLFTICLLFKTQIAFLTIALYVGLGAAGVPVFSNYGSGLGHIAGPTGGYILAFMLMPLVFKIFEKIEHQLLRVSLQMFIAFTVVCVLGTLWYAKVSGKGFTWPVLKIVLLSTYVYFIPYNCIVQGGVAFIASRQIVSKIDESIVKQRI